MIIAAPFLTQPLQTLLPLALLLTTFGEPLPAAADDTLPARLAGHGGPIKAVTVNDDGGRALTASFDYSVILWDLVGKTGTVRARLIGHEAAVNDVAFVPSSNKAVSVSDDGSVAVWDLSDGRLIARATDTPDKVLDVAVSPNGRFAASARWDGTARVHAIADAREIARAEGHRGNVNAVAFSLDGKTLFTGCYDGKIRGFALTDDGRIDGDPTVVADNGWGINVLAPLPGASELAFGSIDGKTGVVDLLTGDVTVLSEGEHPILSLAVSPRVGWLASGSGDGHIRVFDIETGVLAEDYHDAYGPIWGLSFMPDGHRLFRAGLDDFAILWQVEPRLARDEVQSVYPRRFQRQAADDPGEVEFQRKCSVCHTLTPDGAHRAGPTLFGLFGRTAGSVEGYVYSDALKRSGIVWTEKTVGALFDDGPDVMVPGTKMPVQRLKAVERRDALVSFLKRATNPQVSTAKDNQIME
ncbi:Cytochrome c2 precursor [Hartmannibacter diazotrophicus]|uniref:Cytochrome c2 n=1 Tax=Hartmannibacter diazotrophicus TaxID=1482074 RepID=A0A2C9D6Z7_9HYPH|nr:c-type cytochrome [Hartmannibacter diazotrophicus]SON55295.1 Cytochrome c2 precursor [Hartmannibacter diazotrophicus]